jgi:PadR family transcriptional regulator, regulatory protein PadR
MSRGDLLGAFEQLVLVALIRLGDDAYGMTVRREIEERTGRPTSLGAVYATLDRLESKGYVTSYGAPATPERRGRARRFFRIASSACRALEETRCAFDLMYRDLPPLPLPD